MAEVASLRYMANVFRIGTSLFERHQGKLERQHTSAGITVRQCTALRQGDLAGGGLADWRTDSAKSAAPVDWADWVSRARRRTAVG